MVFLLQTFCRSEKSKVRTSSNCKPEDLTTQSFEHQHGYSRACAVNFRMISNMSVHNDDVPRSPTRASLSGFIKHNIFNAYLESFHGTKICAVKVLQYLSSFVGISWKAQAPV